MITAEENYDQNKITGANKQTVILDERETAETDEQDPKFHENDPENADAKDEDEDLEISGEKLYNEPDDSLEQDTANETDLNHNSSDDLSLNKAEGDIF